MVQALEDVVGEWTLAGLEGPRGQSATQLQARLAGTAAATALLADSVEQALAQVLARPSAVTACWCSAPSIPLPPPCNGCRAMPDTRSANADAVRSGTRIIDANLRTVACLTWIRL